jgi:hypothetical protein
LRDDISFSLLKRVGGAARLNAGRHNRSEASTTFAGGQACPVNSPQQCPIHDGVIVVLPSLGRSVQ